MKAVSRMKVTSHVNEVGPGGQWFWVRRFKASRKIDADGDIVYYSLNWAGGGMKMDSTIIERYCTEEDGFTEAGISDEVKSSIHDAFYKQLFEGIKKKLDLYGIILNDDGSVTPPSCPHITNGNWQDFPRVK